MGNKGLPTSCFTDPLFDSLPLGLVWTSSPRWPLTIPQVPAEEYTLSVEPSPLLSHCSESLAPPPLL